MSTISEIRSQAEIIRQATEDGENTAERVGKCLTDIVDKIEETQGTPNGIQRAELTPLIDEGTVIATFHVDNQPAVILKAPKAEIPNSYTKPEVDAMFGGLDTVIHGINTNIDNLQEELDGIFGKERGAVVQVVNDILDGKNFVEGWQAGWNNNVKAYLITVGLLKSDGTSKDWSYLEQQYNELQAAVNSLEQLTDEEGNVINYEALQALIDARIENNSAITELKARYALTDADKKVLQWLSAGLYTAANENKALTELFASAEDVATNTQAISSLRTSIDNLGGTYVAKTELSSYVKSTDIDGLVNTSISGLMTENSTNSAVSELFSRLKSLESATEDEETGLAALKLRIDNLSGANGDFLTEASLVAAITNKKDDIVTTLSSAGLVNTATLNSAKTELEAKVGNAKTEILGEVANDYAATETVAKIVDSDGNIKAQAIASAIADSEGAISTLRAYFATTVDGEEVASGVTSKIASDLGQADWQTAADYIKNELAANSTFRANASSTYATSSQLSSLRSTVNGLSNTVDNLDIPSDQDILDVIGDNPTTVGNSLLSFFNQKYAAAGVVSRVEDLENAGYVASTDVLSLVIDGKDDLISQAGLATTANLSTAQSELISSIDNVESKILTQAQVKDIADASAQTATAGMLVQADLDGYVKKASILASINESGESNVKIDADKINFNDKITFDSEGNATFDGTINATAGTIAGWEIVRNSLYSEINSGSNYNFTDIDPSGIAFEYGSGTPNSSPRSIYTYCQLYSDGLLTYDNNSNGCWITPSRGFCMFTLNTDDYAEIGETIQGDGWRESVCPVAFKNDGSGWIGYGAISWDTAGNMEIKSNSITTPLIYVGKEGNMIAPVGDLSNNTEGIEFDTDFITANVDTFYLEGALRVTGYTQLRGGAVVTGDLNVMSIKTPTSAATTYPLTIDASTVINGTLNVSGNTTFSGTVVADSLDVNSAEIDTLTGGQNGIYVGSPITFGYSAEFNNGIECLGSTIQARTISADPGHLLSLTGDTSVDVQSISGSVRLTASTEITANMNITVSSDETQKNIIGTVAPAIEDIANVRVVDYQLKSDEKKVTHTGTIAQDWQALVPNAVVTTGDGTLALDYSAVAVAASVAAAKEIVALKQENQALRERLAAIEEKLNAMNN